MTNKTNIKVRLLALILMFLSLLSCFNLSTLVYANTTNNSSVLADLSKDSSFNPNDYKEDKSNGGIELLTISESINNSLVIYTYQPSSDINVIAKKIALNTSYEDTNFILYDLELLSNEGVFFKYKVIDFVVSTDVIRFYNISTIYRKFDSLYDNSIDNDNIVDFIGLKVGKFFEYNNDLLYLSNIDVVEITDLFVSFMRYDKGFTFYKDACDAHFLSFSTEINIDNLYSAEVFFVEQSVSKTVSFGEKYNYGEPKEKYVNISYSDIVISEKTGWFFGKTYTWNRIETSEIFLENEDVNSDVEDIISQSDYVLRFYETSYKTGITSTNILWENYTRVSSVGVLRLEFASDGITYNLGVVSDLQSGSGRPANENSSCNDISILDIIFIILLLLFAPIIYYLLLFVFLFLKFIIKVIYIFLKGIIVIFKKIFKFE